MKSIKDLILQEVNQWNKTKLTGRSTDPETGRVSHQVVYTPLRQVDQHLASASSSFKRGVSANEEDMELERLFKEFKKLRRAFRRHVYKTYRDNG